jgi:hypothetical protein
VFILWGIQSHRIQSNVFFLGIFPLLLSWPLLSRLGRLRCQIIKWKYCSYGYMYFFKNNDDDNFSLVFELCSNMNFLEVNAWLQRKSESFSNLANLDYICENFGVVSYVGQFGENPKLRYPHIYTIHKCLVRKQPFETSIHKSALPSKGIEP